MLEQIFQGERGLAAQIVRALGGTAGLRIALSEPRISGVSESRYQTTPVSYAMVEHSESEGALKRPGDRERDREVVSSELRRLESNFVCVVPSWQLASAPRVGVDLFYLDARDYRIDRVEPIRAGGEVVLYRLTCARA